jgi:hypothetical protein
MNIIRPEDIRRIKRIKLHFGRAAYSFKACHNNFLNDAGLQRLP